MKSRCELSAHTYFVYSLKGPVFDRSLFYRILFYRMMSVPIYGMSASGMVTEPSAF